MKHAKGTWSSGVSVVALIGGRDRKGGGGGGVGVGLLLMRMRIKTQGTLPGTCVVTYLLI